MANGMFLQKICLLALLSVTGGDRRHEEEHSRGLRNIFSSNVTVHAQDQWPEPQCPMTLHVPVEPDPINICLRHKKLRRIIPGESPEADDDYSPAGDTLVEGYVIGKQSNSAVRGYLDKYHFFGSIQTETATYWIERAADRPFWGPERNYMAVIYEPKNALSTVRKRSSERLIQQRLDKYLLHAPGPGIIKLSSYEDGVLPNTDENRIKGMTCPLKLLGDRDFWIKVGRTRTPLAKRLMLYYVDEVNAIFRATDFNGDGKADNIGLEVVEIEVDKRLTAQGMQVGNNFRKYVKIANKVDRGFNNYCLGVIFTTEPFDHISLGYSGKDAEGICMKAKNGKRPRNVIVVTVSSENYFLLPTHAFLTTFLHQLGHAFGAQDDGQSDLVLCKTGDVEGHYVMGLGSHPWENTKNMWTFSPCSVRAMGRKIQKHGDCLLPFNGSFCGNAVREKGEECDCGMVMDCLKRNCCGARGNPNACKFLTDTPEYMKSMCPTQEDYDNALSFSTGLRPQRLLIFLFIIKFIY